MEIIGVDDRDDTVFAKLSKDDFAKLTGFKYSNSMKENLKVGQIYDVGQLYKDAEEALELHEKALKAAQQLKASSTRFLSFFKEKENKS